MVEVKEKNIAENEYSVSRKVKEAYKISTIFAIVFAILISMFELFDGGIGLALLLIFIANFVGTFFIIPLAIIFKSLTEIKNRKDVAFDGVYCRELPEDVKPAVIAYRLQGKNVDNTDISATIIDLIRRKVLIIESENIDIDALGENENLILRFNQYDNQIVEYERYLVEWFITDVENGVKKINFKKVREQVFKEENADNRYAEFEKLVSKEVKNREKEYSSKSRMARFSKLLNKISNWLIGIGIIIFVLFLAMVFGQEILEEVYKLDLDMYGMIGAMFFVLAFLFPLCALIIKTLRVPDKYLSDEEIEMRKKWLGYRKYIKEYSLINKRESFSDIFLWEEYLVYAVAFGDATGIIEKMRRLYGFKLV